MITPRSVVLAEPVPMWLLDSGGNYRNKKELSPSKLDKAVDLLHPHYQNVVLPAFVDQVVKLVPTAKTAFQDALPKLLGTRQKLKVALGVLTPTVDPRILRGDDECKRQKHRIRGF
jgi:hypothetical protein